MWGMKNGTKKCTTVWKSNKYKYENKPFNKLVIDSQVNGTVLNMTALWIRCERCNTMSKFSWCFENEVVLSSSICNKCTNIYHLNPPKQKTEYIINDRFPAISKLLWFFLLYESRKLRLLPTFKKGAFVAHSITQ